MSDSMSATCEVVRICITLAQRSHEDTHTALLEKFPRHTVDIAHIHCSADIIKIPDMQSVAIISTTMPFRK